jgi:L-aspartate oxidase
LWACGEVAATGLHGANRLASNSLLEAVVCGRLVAQDIAGVDCGPARIIQTGAIPVLPVCEDFVAAIREAMEYDVGVVRSAAGLDGAIQLLDALRQTAMGTEDEDIAGAALMIAQAALRRRESRGAHFRSDATPPIEPGRSGLTRALSADPEMALAESALVEHSRSHDPNHPGPDARARRIARAGARRPGRGAGTIRRR